MTVVEITMLKKLKTITLQMIAGANIATIIIMFFLGFSDYVYPASHPYIACAGLMFPLFLFFNLLFLIFWVLFHFRGVWIPVLGFILCYAPIKVYYPINKSKKVPSGAIKILSYNVESFGIDSVNADGTYPVIEYIRNSDADIVCLQEDMADEQLRNKINNRLSRYKYRDVNKIGDANGMGFYSRYPIISKERIWYESQNNGSMAYHLKIGTDTILVINNHFENCHLTQDDRKSYKKILKGQMKKDTAKIESKKLIQRLALSGAIRCHQVDKVVEYIKAHSRESIILCGDFNDNPISYSRRMIAKELTDCYVKTANGIGISYNRRGFYVRIDNIMCSSDWTPYNCKVDKKTKASDHYPIYCWMKKHRKL